MRLFVNPEWMNKMIIIKYLTFTFILYTTSDEVK